AAVTSTAAQLVLPTQLVRTDAVASAGVDPTTILLRRHRVEQHLPIRIVVRVDKADHGTAKESIASLEFDSGRQGSIRGDGFEQSRLDRLAVRDAVAVSVLSQIVQTHGRR